MTKFNLNSCKNSYSLKIIQILDIYYSISTINSNGQRIIIGQNYTKINGLLDQLSKMQLKFESSPRTMALTLYAYCIKNNIDPQYLLSKIKLVNVVSSQIFGVSKYKFDFFQNQDKNAYNVQANYQIKKNPYFYNMSIIQALQNAGQIDLLDVFNKMFSLNGTNDSIMQIIKQKYLTEKVLT